MTKENADAEDAVRDRLERLSAAMPVAERPMPTGRAASIAVLAPVRRRSGRTRSLAIAALVAAVTIVAGLVVVASRGDSRRVNTTQGIETQSAVDGPVTAVELSGTRWLVEAYTVPVRGVKPPQWVNVPGPLQEQLPLDVLAGVVVTQEDCGAYVASTELGRALGAGCVDDLTATTAGPPDTPTSDDVLGADATPVADLPSARLAIAEAISGATMRRADHAVIFEQFDPAGALIRAVRARPAGAAQPQQVPWTNLAPSQWRVFGRDSGSSAGRRGAGDQHATQFTIMATSPRRAAAWGPLGCNAWQVADGQWSQTTIGCPEPSTALDEVSSEVGRALAASPLVTLEAARMRVPGDQGGFLAEPVRSRVDAATPAVDPGARPVTASDVAGHVFLFSAGRDLSTGLDHHLVGIDHLSVSFFDDGTLGGTTGCHQFGGTYRVGDDGTLDYTRGGFGNSNLLFGCDDVRTAQEQWIEALFDANPTLSIAGDALTIRSTDAELVAAGLSGRFDDAMVSCTGAERQVIGFSDYFAQFRAESSADAALAEFLAAHGTAALGLLPLHDDATTIKAAADSTSIIGVKDGRLVFAVRLRFSGGTWAVTSWKACTQPGTALNSSGPFNESESFVTAIIGEGPRFQLSGTLVEDSGVPGGCILLATDAGQYLIRWPDGTHRDLANLQRLVLPDGRSFGPGTRLQLDGALNSAPQSYPFTQLVMSSECVASSTTVRPSRITATS